MEACVDDASIHGLIAYVDVVMRFVSAGLAPGPHYPALVCERGHRQYRREQQRAKDDQQLGLRDSALLANEMIAKENLIDVGT